MLIPLIIGNYYSATTWDPFLLLSNPHLYFHMIARERIRYVMVKTASFCVVSGHHEHNKRRRKR